MKKLLFLLPIIMTGSTIFAQNACSKDHPVYNTDKATTPKVVYRLGSNPEFPFLQNLSTPNQVLAAMKSKANAQKYPRQMKELNRMLVEIGFSDGVNDVTVSNIASYKIPAGTTGNMGDGHLNYGYTRLEGANKKAWKVTSGGECYISFLAACGNAFYAFGNEKTNTYTGNLPKCKDEEVAVTSDPKTVTVSDAKQVTKKTYVYYKKGCPCEDCGQGWSQAGYDNDQLSRPLLVKKEEVSVPQTYKVSTSGTGKATVCAGKTTEVTTDLQVEKENEYTGYKPAVTREYIQVSKKEYRRARRDKDLMRDIEGRPALQECKTCEYNYDTTQ